MYNMTTGLQVLKGWYHQHGNTPSCGMPPKKTAWLSRPVKSQQLRQLSAQDKVQ